MVEAGPMMKESSKLPSFIALYGRPSESSTEAPGRVNLMGDHTDYNGGYVLPMVLPRATRVEAAVRSDNVMHVWTANADPANGLKEYTLGQERRVGDWADYAQAITGTLRADGYVFPGMDLRIASDIPLGAGLSSSASFLVALLKAIRGTADLNLSDVEIAHLAHRAETDFVGAPVGIMDQMVCALGRPDAAFFLDTANLHYEHMPLPTGIEWVVIHSGISHSHATGSYQDRRQECTEACRLLGVASLRALHELPRTDAWARIESLPAPLNARARHVFTENERVLSALEALRLSDMRRFGALMYASHGSLRDDFKVSIPEIDLLIDLARADDAVYGARLTGGGFGGSIVLAVEMGTAEETARRLCDRYNTMCDSRATIIVPVAHDQADRHP